MSVLRRTLQRLHAPVNGTVLGWVRLVYGGVMVYEFARQWVVYPEHYGKSAFFFTYDLFHWVPFPGLEHLTWLCALGMGASLLVALGIAFRPACATVTLLHTWFLLFDKGHYTNHHYLYCTVGLLLCFTDAHRNLSVQNGLKAAPVAIPRWQTLLLPFQFVVVYFFGAVAKMDSDWLAGYPMRQWLPAVHFMWEPPWVTETLRAGWFALTISWSGLFLDLFAGLLLPFRRGRWFILPFITAFHLLNSLIWKIGSFPWTMLLLMFVFFPDSLNRLLHRVFGRPLSTSRQAPARPRSLYRPGLVLLSGYVCLELFLPLRQHLYPGWVAWTGEGHHFAWRMMLVASSQSVTLQYQVPGQTGRQYASVHADVAPKQFRKSVRQPTNWIRYAHWWADRYEAQHGIRPKVYLNYRKSVNGRRFQPALDPNVNYADAPYRQVLASAYLLPFEDTPLPGEAIKPQPRGPTKRLGR